MTEDLICVLCGAARPHSRSVMPKELMHTCIRDIPPGDSAYTVPWALKIDRVRHAWLDLDEVTEPVREGSFQVLVTHHENGEWTVEIPRAIRFRWKCSGSGSPFFAQVQRIYIVGKSES